MTDINKLLVNLYKNKIVLSVNDDRLKINCPKDVMTPEFLEQIKQNKSEIVAYLEAQSNPSKTLVGAAGIVKRGSGADKVLASFAQQRLWFLAQFETSGAEYNMFSAFGIEGEFDVAVAEQAISRIIARHESLRTVFTSEDGEVMQVIRSDFDFAIARHDLTALTEDQRHKHLEQLLHAESVKPFDLSKDLVVRAAFIQLAADASAGGQNILLFNMHHIASDGRSLAILMDEFVAQYQAVSQGQADSLAPLAIQYADYAQWQRDWLQGEVLEQQLNYWSRQLEEVPAVHSLPLSYARPETKNNPGAEITQVLGTEVSARLQQLAQRYQLTPFMLLHGALALVLSRHSNSTDIVIGTPVANRMQAELETLIGFFVNSLVLRVNTAHESLAAYLAHVREVNLDAQAHQDIPFEQLVEHCKVPRSTNHAPLVQIMFNMSTSETAALTNSCLSLTPMDSADTIVKHDLNIDAKSSKDGIRFSWKYDTSLFSAESVASLANHLKLLLENIATGQYDRLADLNMLSQQEKDYLLNTLNDVRSDLHETKLIHQLFEAQAQQRPDAVAVVFEDEQLTYREVNEKANRLAYYLREQGVETQTLVGICMERSLDMVVGIIAVLKSGGAYVPLDSKYPESRIEYMVEDSGIRYLLTQSQLTGLFGSEPALEMIVLDCASTLQKLSVYAVGNVPPHSTQSPQNLAYVMYTSGSTGRPKGVLQTHQNVTRLFLATDHHFDFCHDDVWCQFHSIAFDFSVWELWGALVYGGRLVIPSHDCTRDIGAFVELCRRQQVSVLNQTPGAFSVFSQMALQDGQKLAALRYVIFGGEALQIDSLIPWWDEYGDNQPQLINMYGITETTVHASFKRLSREDVGSSVVGERLIDQSFYLLGPDRQPVPWRAVGELYIGGAGLARGYLNQPELTETRFIPDPFSADPQARLYRTGDLLRYCNGKQLEFVGRADEQVKIRGFRIELGEIENKIKTLPAVGDALVLVKELTPGNKQLIAYVVKNEHPDEAQTEFVGQLRKHLQTRLPDYMMPSAMVVLERFPLTPNGKIDKKALPTADAVLLEGEYVPPANETEQTLVAIWSNLLSLDAERLSVTANFFELGGHSLLAVRLAAEVYATLQVELAIKTVFEAPTIALLAQQLTDKAQAFSRTRIVAVPRQPEADMITSFSQQRLWILDKIDGGSVHYNMPAALRLTGELNVDALTRAFNTLTERHESLRTHFVEASDGQPRQVIRSEFKLEIPMTDLSALPVGEREFDLAALVTQQAAKPFDLSQDLMLRVQLVKLDAQVHVLLVTLHHIASDGWSMGVMVNEFSKLYQAYVQGEDNPLAPLAVQYADYAQWQRDWLQGEVLEAQLGFWENQLAGLPVVHGLSLDKARPQEQTYNGASHCSVITAVVGDRLNSLSQGAGGTLFMGLHAAFSVLLSRYSNETDIVVGSPIANREQAEVADLIGFFVNTLVLRSDLSDNPSFNRLLARSKSTLLDAYAHQQVPFEQIVEKLQPERSLSHSPLFQVMLILQNNESVELILPGLVLTQITQSDDIAKYDLTLDIAQTAEGLHLSWEYNTSLFNAETIERMAQHFELLLTGLVNQPDESVFAVDWLSGEETQQQLVEFNKSASTYPKEQCIHALFEAQAKQNPDAVALAFEQRELSYGELNAKANQLARYLIEERQVRPDTLVGLCVERSFDMMVGILAILKAGGAYVPLDPSYPAAHLAYMLEDANLKTVLTQSHLKGETPINDNQAVYLDDEALLGQLAGYEQSDLAVEALRSHHLAYVIYTSGSTGHPKGVMVEHVGLTAHILSCHEHYGLSTSDSVLQFSTINFDAAQEQIFSALTVGATLCLIRDKLLSEADFFAACQSHGLSVVDLPPSYAQLLFNYAGKNGAGFENTGIRLMIVGGESLPPALLLDWRAVPHDFRLINAYGPTETVITAASYEFDKTNPDEVIAIGKPGAFRQAYVCSEQGKLQPMGVAGELYIGGAGLARGYLNQPALTARQFIANPFYDVTDPNSSERLYKTGDLVRYLPDGNLAFLGRIDHQVKIRGFRIELGEIEQQLLSQENVNDAVVVALPQDAGDKRLVAYVTHDDVEKMLAEGEAAKTLHRAFIGALRDMLGQALPDYMVPSAFVVLEQLPLTPNGKVDRKGLPAPDMSLQQKEYVAPTTETEKLLCAIWQAVLGLEQVGVTDNFFGLGGHSLLVMNVIAKAQQAGVNIAAKDFFAAPQLSALAAGIDSNQHEAAPASVVPENLIPDGCRYVTPEMLPLTSLKQSEIDRIAAQIPGGASNIEDIYPLGPLQEGILFTHRMSDNTDPYVTPMLFELKGKAAVEYFIESFQCLINRHDVLRTAVFWQDLTAPVQVVCKEAKLPVSWLDLEPGCNIDEQMQTLLLPENQWMDLTEAPLINLRIAKADNDERYLVLLQSHHITTDHVGLEIIQHELNMISKGQGDNLPPAVPYRNFIARIVQQAKENDAQAYFSDLLGDIDEPTTPFGLADVQNDGTGVNELAEKVPAAVASQIRALSKSLKISPASLFHSAFGLVVGACSGRQDVVFGSVMSGRLQGFVGSEAMLGVFINTLPIRLNMEAVNVLDFVMNTQSALRDLLPYEQTSLTLTQSCSSLANNTPLFSAMFNYRHSSAGRQTDGEATPMKLLQSQERTNYPFNLSVDDFGVDFVLDFQVDTSVCVKRVVSYMQTALAVLAEQLVACPEKRLSELSVLGHSETRQQLLKMNDTAMPFAQELCIHALFEAQVKQNPEAVAVVFEKNQLTYRELNQRANQLAHYLVEQKQVTPDTLVGICVERSFEMIVGIVAILKAGGAYVPLDPSYPAARLAYMLDDAGLTTVLTQTHLKGETPVDDEQAVYLDDETLQIRLKDYPLDDLAIDGLTAKHMAYVIYTSGSTGNPKGVMVEHQALHNRIDWMNRQYGCTTEDKILQKTPFSFDVSVWELFWPICVGAQLVFARPEGHKEPEYLAQLIVSQNVSKMHFVPSMLSNMLASGVLNRCHPLKQVFCSGEALSPVHVKDFFALLPCAQLHNLYGPTEAAIDVSYWHCGAHDVERVPIGKPISNIQLHVINDGTLVPLGASGELHIGGVGLARGYLNQPELTAQKFIVNPYYDAADPNSSERLYKTGDLVRYLSDGNLEFLGRIDHQVKIRGFRIELSEIEQQLLFHCEVNDAVVMAVTNEALDDADKALVAYVTHNNAVAMQDSSEQAQLLLNDFTNLLREKLSRNLPDYMVPSAFVLLDQLPLTPNGKVDRKALPAPDMSMQQKAYVAPTTDIQKLLCEIWQEVLGIERVSITDNFFELGGHSLLAVKLVTLINEKLGTNLTIRNVFAMFDIVSLSDYIEVILDDEETSLTEEDREEFEF